MASSNGSRRGIPEERAYSGSQKTGIHCCNTIVLRQKERTLRIRNGRQIGMIDGRVIKDEENGVNTPALRNPDQGPGENGAPCFNNMVMRSPSVTDGCQIFCFTIADMSTPRQSARRFTVFGFVVTPLSVLETVTLFIPSLLASS